MSSIGCVVCCSILLSMAVGSMGQSCPNAFNNSAVQDPPAEVRRSLKLWQGVLLIVCFGVFGLLVASVHRLIRAFVFYDNHLLDTFFDAGGEANFAIVACSVVAKRLWVASYTFSTADVTKFGLVGHFWYSAAGVIHLLLFAILASEIRIKAPGARTFLQVIRSRFGAAPHVIVMIFAFVTNVIVAGLVMAEGTRVLTWLCQGIDQYVICIILTLSVGLYTLIGGLGGAMYMAYFLVATVVSIYLVYFSDTAFNSLNRPDHRFQDFFAESYSSALCADPSKGSKLTFQSKEGLLQGIIFALAGFSSVFVNQGFWLTAISARPTHSVWGYLTGALVWFGVPFILSFVLGMSYWSFAATQGTHLINGTQIASGVLPVLVSQQLLGRIGDFMMYSLTIAVVLGCVSSEILSISSIIVYDIFQTYVHPFNFCSALAPPSPSPAAAAGGIYDSTNADVAAVYEKRKADAGDLYLSYNRRCVIVQWVTVIAVSLLVYPITLVVMAIGMQTQWLFNFLGVIVGSAVLPVALAVVWHRTTASGVISGVVIGLVSGLTAWLVYASRFEHGLSWFQSNTGRQEVFITGLAASLGVGGLVCALVSLTCGGCDPHRNEEEEWEKCRSVDNPFLPWTVRYSSDVTSVNQHTGLPHFYALRRAYKGAEISAYVLGVLLSAGALLVWPALMLVANVFTAEVFRNWGVMVFIWAVVAGAFICIIPLLYEIFDKCCVSYRIRLWKHRLLSSQQEQQEQPTCGDFQTMTTLVQSSGTCQRPCTVARQTIRLADLTGKTGTVGYPATRFAANYGAGEYCSYPSSSFVGTNRLGTATKGWQTLVHLD